MKQIEKSGTMEKNRSPLLIPFLEAAGIYQQRIEDRLKEIGLSRTLYVTLEQLARAGAPLTQRELAAGEQCAASNITQKIDRLEKEGLVRRLADPTDRRSILAELTSLGAERAADGSRIIESVAASFDAALSTDERALLAGILDRLASE
jgi:MarR family transcriptional regulator, transcriptional regulator for hemolysin